MTKQLSPRPSRHVASGSRCSSSGGGDCCVNEASAARCGRGSDTTAAHHPQDSLSEPFNPQGAAPILGAPSATRMHPLRLTMPKYTALRTRTRHADPHRRAHIHDPAGTGRRCAWGQWRTPAACKRPAAQLSRGPPLAGGQAHVAARAALATQHHLHNEPGHHS